MLVIIEQKRDLLLYYAVCWIQDTPFSLYVACLIYQAVASVKEENQELRFL